MDKRAPHDPAVIAALPLRATEPDACVHALSLLGAHAVRVDETGGLLATDPDGLRRALFDTPDTLQLGAPGWEARMSAADVRARRAALSRLCWPGARMQIDYGFRDGQGGTRQLRETLEAVARPDGSLIRRGVVMDRTEEAERRAREVWAARHDAVTHLPNRTVLVESAALLAALGTRARLDANLVRLRVSNLGEIENVYGPECVDRLLCALAERLASAVRAPDALARVSPSDFAVCALGSDIAAVQARLRADASETPYSTAFGPLYLDVDTASIRLSPVPGGAEDALRQTAARLDGVPAGAATLAPRTDVLDALERDRISLAFQPIVHARSGEVHHHECLLRIRGADGRMISAGPIVGEAERLGLVDRLDQRALALATPFLRANPELRLALNVSAGTLGDAPKAARYLEALAALGEDARRLTIEMTETLAVDDPAAAARFSADVRALGCRFAVDDFGSGYTTFRNLMAVEADSLKIDGSLIRGIATDPNKQTFMRMMVDLAQTFSVQTVAEMVECEADAAVLRRLGADYLQGYHFGYPAPSPVWSRVGR